MLWLWQPLPDGRSGRVTWALLPPAMMVLSINHTTCKGCQQLLAVARVTEAEGSSMLGGGSTADVRAEHGDAGMSSVWGAFACRGKDSLYQLGDAGMSGTIELLLVEAKTPHRSRFYFPYPL